MTFGAPRSRSILVGCTVLCLAACEEAIVDPGDDPPAVTGVSVTASANPVDVTETVTVTATVAPAEASQAVTWSSSDEGIATVDVAGLVTFQRRGEVTITATSTADPTRSGSVVLTVECPDPRLLASPTEDVTWENWVPDPDCYDYIAQFGPGSNDYAITIEPGTVIGFEEGVPLRIRQRAALLAEGTEAEPIVLTGIEKERGSWPGLSLEGVEDGRSVLEWVTVEYAGAPLITGEDAALKMLEDAVATVRHSTFRESAGYGVSLSRLSRFTDPEGNLLTENALGPAHAVAEAVPALNGATMTGNDSDVVIVSTGITMRGDFSWPAATYRILEAGRLGIDEGLLTLAPGSELRFEALQDLTVWDEGGLNAVGTPAEPIVFTGTEATPGHWAGIAFFGSSHASNRLEHVVVEYAGGETIASDEPANVALTRAGSNEHSTVAIQSTTLRHGAGYGLWLRRDSSLPGFSGNALTANAAGPARVDAPAAHWLQPGNSYGGNAIDEVTVETGSALTITDDVTWEDLGVPYYLMYDLGSDTSVEAALTLAEGVQILVAPELGISFSAGGTIQASGGSNNPISISAKSAPWKGILISGTSGSSLVNVNISGAGSTPWGGVGVAAALSMYIGSSTAAQLTASGTSLSGVDFEIAFGTGATVVFGCVGRISVPDGDTVVQHCP